jgi:phenylalanyl-tRNA synthetase alpha chain
MTENMKVEEILGRISATNDEKTLETIRVELLGKSGSITTLARLIGQLPTEERRGRGSAINEIKNQVTEAISLRREELKKRRIAAEVGSIIASTAGTGVFGSRKGSELSSEDFVKYTHAVVIPFLDVTLPVREAPFEIGRVHPITQTTDELTAIFADMGFSIAEGPDIETDDYNFTTLNIPENHPARDMHDTFFFNPKPDGTRLLLRTHTSPVQVRTMLSQKPPIRIITPGRTYRCDSDQTHTPMFHQVEGLVIDKGSHLGHLKWILEEFFKAFFEVDRVGMRFRPSYFPFTEPSLEVDIQCRRDKGEIRFGEGNDWLEVLGCGMVHPNVLRNCGLDPDEYQGFAWGMGIERIAALKYGMPDLRAFFDADVRWLSHYGFRPLDFPTLAGGLSA